MRGTAMHNTAQHSVARVPPWQNRCWYEWIDCEMPVRPRPKSHQAREDDCVRIAQTRALESELRCKASGYYYCIVARWRSLTIVECRVVVLIALFRDVSPGWMPHIVCVRTT